MSKTSLGRVSLVPKGTYNAVTAYERLDVVTYEGAGYIVLRDVQGVTPVDGEDYMLLAEGLPGPKGDPGDTPELSIGTVTTLEPGSEAKASFTGTKEKPVLNLELPRGATGGVDVESAEVGQIIIVKAVDENGKPIEWEAADMVGGGAEPKQLYNATFENVASVDELIDLQGYKNYCIIIYGTKGDAAITIPSAHLYAGGTDWHFGYFTAFLSALTNEAYPNGSVLHDLKRIAEDVFAVEYNRVETGTTQISAHFQGSSSIWTSSKRGHLQGFPSTHSDGIEISFSTTVESVTVNIYGY